MFLPLKTLSDFSGGVTGGRFRRWGSPFADCASVLDVDGIQCISMVLLCSVGQFNGNNALELGIASLLALVANFTVIQLKWDVQQIAVRQLL